MRSLAAAALALVAGGCLKADVNRCGTGAICKQSQACTEVPLPATQCGEPSDVAACFGMPMHTACDRSDGQPGTCDLNLCGACNANFVECRYKNTWTPMESGITMKIYALHVFTASDVYAGSDSGVLHYDGLAWSTLPAPTGSAYYEVWGTSGADLFVFDKDLHEYRNGVLDVTEQGTQTAPMKSAWGPSSDDMTAVGGGVVGHRSSSGWSWSVQSNNSVYNAVTGLGGTTVVVGQDGAGAAVWTASGTIVTLFSTMLMSPAANYKANAVWGTSASDFFVVGGVASTTGFIYRYSGGMWRPVDLTGMQIPVGTLNGVWGRSVNDVYAVGDGGAILHFDGTDWTRMTSPSDVVQLLAVDGRDGDVFVAGATGAIWKYAEP